MAPKMKGQMEFKLEPRAVREVRLMSADEIYSGIEGLNPVDIKENSKIERKLAGIQPRALGDYFSIFANSPPDGGIILIGVADDGSVHGCKQVGESHLNDLERAGDVYCPEARYTCRHVKITNRANQPDSILAIRVHYRPDKVVETTDGTAWIRRGESKRKLHEEEKRELKDSKGQVDVELETVPLQFPDDFKMDLIRQFVDAVRPQRRLQAEMPIDEVLVLRHLGKRVGGRFQPNLACALLFAKDPQAVAPGCRIRFFRYNGNIERTGEQYNVIKSEWIEGTVPELIANAEKVIDSQLREFQRLGKDSKFYAVPEYPKPAWYEAIVNACVHRSYALRNMNIFVKMFDNRLVVESPGGFPPFVTPKNIYHMHQPRNVWLMDALFYLKFVQCAHEGTQRIRDYMLQQGLPPPIFAQQEVGNALVQVTLKNDVEHRKEFIDTDAFRILGEKLSNSLSDTERRIVNFIAENRTINVMQVVSLTAMRWHRCKKILTALVDREILDHVHDPKIERDRNQYYTLKKKFNDRIRE